MPSDEENMKLCGDCSLCCAYVTVEIGVPKNADDLDYMAWLLMHKNVSIFIDDDGWYVQFLTPCKHQNGKCAIYQGRPGVCREYEHHECERYTGDGIHTHFNDQEGLFAYVKDHRPELWKEAMQRRTKRQEGKETQRPKRNS